jgi:hypothetical protein
VATKTSPKRRDEKRGGGTVRKQRQREREREREGGRERERERNPHVSILVVLRVWTEFKVRITYLLARSGEPSLGVDVDQDMARIYYCYQHYCAANTYI